MTTRVTRRVAVVLGTVAVALSMAVPAFALDDGEVHHTKLSVGETILIYVVIPVGIFAVISFLAVLPSLLRRPRYRPGRPWNYDPLWFSGADDPDRALVAARPGVTARGGASAEW